MGRRGPKQRTECVNGHDLSDEDNVKVVRRVVKGVVYPERVCRACTNARNRAYQARRRAEKRENHI